MEGGGARVKPSPSHRRAGSGRAGCQRVGDEEAPCIGRHRSRVISVRLSSPGEDRGSSRMRIQRRPRRLAAERNWRVPVSGRRQRPTRCTERLHPSRGRDGRMKLGGGWPRPPRPDLGAHRPCPRFQPV